MTKLKQHKRILNSHFQKIEIILQFGRKMLIDSVLTVSALKKLN